MFTALSSRNVKVIFKQTTLLHTILSRGYIEKALEDIAEPRCKVHRLNQCPNITGRLTREEALLYFKQMNLIRRMETTSGLLYHNSYVTGFCHLYSGQEACAVGVSTIMRPQDTCITSYRCHAWVLLKCGISEDTLKVIFKELMGKSTGLCGGKSGSMHLFAKNFYGGNGVVGQQVSIGTGLAFAHKYKNDGGICFIIMGDGAINCGQVFESFNLARLHNLPAIYLIENNNYGMGTAVSRVSANIDLYKRGDLVPGIRISGMDVTSVRDTTKFAVSHVLDGKGPIIIELLTYRYSGHSVADPGTTYRTREDVKRMKDKFDPIEFLRNYIKKHNLANKDDLKVIDKSNKILIDKAIEEALKDPEPSQSALVTTVTSEQNKDIRTPRSFNDILKGFKR